MVVVAFVVSPLVAEAATSASPVVKVALVQLGALAVLVGVVAVRGVVVGSGDSMRAVGEQC